MNFEKLYSKLPNFIKYNRHIFGASLDFSKRLQNRNQKSDINDFQHKLLELIFINSNLKLKGTLRNIQLLYVELLRFVDKVCKKYDIDYWIADGTLLGAVRHGGFIPWDDDIDLALLREDYDKLIEVLPKEISKFDFFKEECGLTLLREGNKNYFDDFKNIYDVNNEKNLLIIEECLFLQLAWLKPYIKLDFFPIDFVQKDKLDYFNKNYIVTKYEFYDVVKEGIKNFDEELKIKNDEVGFTDEQTNFLNYSLDHVNYLPPWIFKFDNVFPLTTIEFEGYEFNCPKNPDHYLKVLYGDDYMHLPKVMEWHNGVEFVESQFNSIEEMNDKFEKSISYLKEINENFEKFSF